MRRRARKDLIHAEVARALTAAGGTVADTSQLGGGFPDIVYGRGGVTWMLECKDSNGSHTPAQKEFIARWRGGPVLTIHSVQEALEVVGAIAKRAPDEKVNNSHYGEVSQQRIDAILKSIRGGSRE
jgi:Holliday junction resolvase